MVKTDFKDCAGCFVFVQSGDANGGIDVYVRIFRLTQEQTEKPIDQANR